MVLNMVKRAVWLAWTAYSWVRFTVSVLLHKLVIILVARFVLNPCLPRPLRLSWLRLLAHDLSKFHPSEFFPYAAKYYGPRSDVPAENDKVAKTYHRAEQLHCSRNEHHPEYFHRDGRGDEATLMKMSDEALAEMAVDLFAACVGYQFTWPRPGRWGYLHAVLPKKNMHPLDKLRIAAIFSILGFEADLPWFDWRAAATTIRDAHDHAALAHFNQLERAYHRNQGCSLPWLWLASWST